MIRINEVFKSIQGESTYVGQITTFIRTTGCHLRCTYCDTKYSYHEGTWRSIDSLIEEVRTHRSRFVCVTGGEPLLQNEVFQLMTQLCDMGLKVSLETSGGRSCELVDPRVRLILDVKTPDSGAADSFDLQNLEVAKKIPSEFKFVICSEKDFLWAVNFCQAHKIFDSYDVHFSPSFGLVSERWLAEKIIASDAPARLHLQLHKYIWSKDQRGV